MSDTTNTERPKNLPEWVDAFLAGLREHGTVRDACAPSDRRVVPRSTAYKYRNEYAWFRAEWDRALEEGKEAIPDKIEATALRLAIEGWEEPVFHQGQKIGTVRKFSATLLIFLLKAWMPARYQFAERAESDVSASERATQIRDAMRAMNASVTGPEPAIPEPSRNGSNGLNGHS